MYHGSQTIPATAEELDGPGRGLAPQDLELQQAKIAAGRSTNKIAKTQWWPYSSVKISADSFLDFMEITIMPQLLARFGTSRPFHLFMDNCPSHAARKTLRTLSRRYPNMMVEAWPAQSPDLNPLDFSIWSNASVRWYAGCSQCSRLIPEEAARMCR